MESYDWECWEVGEIDHRLKQCFLRYHDKLFRRNNDVESCDSQENGIETNQNYGICRNMSIAPYGHGPDDMHGGVEEKLDPREFVRCLFCT